MVAVTDSETPVVPDPQSGTARPSGSTEAERSAEALLAECLALSESEWSRAIRDACEQRPELAGPLEQLFRNVHAIDEVLRPAEAAPQLDDELPVPSTLGDFELLERVGGGGMGVVYRARQVSLDRTVALKLIRPEHLFFEKSKVRFRREAEAISRLHHPGIVPLYEAGEEGRLPYFAMEFIEGLSVASVLNELRFRSPAKLRAFDFARAFERGGSTPSASPEGIFAAGFEKKTWAAHCCRLIARAAHALEHAHQNGVIHRDIKPSNLMVTDSGRVVIVDFGLAIAEGAPSLTRTGSHPGSLPYMSPEQISGEQVDFRSDIYSLGVTLYELLTLRCPFPLTNPDLARRQIAAGEFERPRSRNRALSAEIEAVCLKAMERERSHRYPSASAFAEDLANAVTHRPIRAQPFSIERRLLRLVQRHPARSLAIGALFLALVVGPLLLAWQQYSHASSLSREQEVTKAATLRSQQSEEEARAASEFLKDILLAASPYSSGKPDLTVREALKDSIAKADARFAHVPRVHVRVLTMLGALFESNGMIPEAIGGYDHAAVVVRRHFGPEDPQLIAPLLGVSRYRRAAEGERIVREALGIASRHPEHELASICEAYERLSFLEYASGKLAAAEESIRMAVNRADLGIARSESDSARLAVWRARLISCHAQLADVLRVRGAIGAAYELASRSLSEARRTLGAESASILPLVAVLQDMDISAGRLDSAKTLARDAERIATAVFGPLHPETIRARTMSVRSLIASNPNDPSLSAQMDRLLADCKAQRETVADWYSNVLATQSTLLEARGDLVAAGEVASSVIDIQERLGQPCSPSALTALSMRARGKLVRGDVDGAMKDSTRAMSVADCGYGILMRAGPTIAAVCCEFARGNLVRAEQLIRTAVIEVRLSEWKSELTVRSLERYLCMVLWRQGKLNEARALQERCLKQGTILTKLAVLSDLAAMEYNLGNLAEARAALRQILDIAIPEGDVCAPFVTITKHRLAQVVLVDGQSEADVSLVSQLLAFDLPGTVQVERRIERAFLRGLLLVAKGETSTGRAVMKEALNASSRSMGFMLMLPGQAQFEYALAAFREGDYGESEDFALVAMTAMTAMTNSFDRVPWMHARVRLLLARCLARADQLDEAGLLLAEVSTECSGQSTLGWELVRRELAEARQETPERTTPESRLVNR